MARRISCGCAEEVCVSENKTPICNTLCTNRECKDSSSKDVAASMEEAGADTESSTTMLAEAADAAVRTGTGRADEEDAAGKDGGGVLGANDRRASCVRPE